MKGFILKQSSHQNHLKTSAFFAGVCTAVLLVTGQAQAQAVYRVIGADGRVTFSDKPPAAANVTATGAASKQIGSGGQALPYELLQVVRKFPVTLYTASNCVPCGSGRALLISRGIPFAEKTVATPEDAEALQRLSGENSLPFLTIGSQQIKGYSDSEWTQFLDAAGYPKSSALPASYHNPLATPLVTVQKLAPAEKSNETQTPPALTQPNRPPVVSPSNPAGITF